jgi:zinc ribbon protein/Sel1 repeat-containing protein
MKEQVVKCRNCGHDNPAEYRFCGMCGRTIPEPDPPIAARFDEPQETDIPESRDRRTRSADSSEQPSETSISGPSFLGIGERSSAPEFSYLLEDEPSRGAGRVLAALIIILALGAAGWWQVHRHGGRQWLYSVLRDPKVLTQTGKSEDGVPADRLNRSQAALRENTNNPNASKETDLQVEDHTLVPKDGGPVETKKSDSQNPANAGGEASAKEPSSNSAPGHVNAEEAVRKQGSSNTEESSADKQKADGTEAAVRKPSEGASRPKPSPRSGLEQATAKESDMSSPASQVDASNVRVAEKYLYGQGVPQDCGRALSLLQPAANSSNPKARSLLGTMYATGHCVPRDLPNSYRWFALSLREQPNNIWVSRNLQSVWNQMSDSEKQTAMRLTK